MAEGIEFHNVDFTYTRSRRVALKDCSLHIPNGSIYGLVGPNGAGKTTLLRLISGMLKCDRGSVELDDIYLESDGTLDKTLFSVLLENPGVYKKLTIYEYLTFFGQFYDVENLDERIRLVSDSLELPVLGTKMKELSLGNIQKVHIARCFLSDFRLVLLDEPTSNLDPVSKERVWELINRYSREFNTTVVVCSHQLHELEEHCTHFGFIKNGHIAFDGTSDNLLIKEQSLVRVTTVGNVSNDLKIQLEKAVGSPVNITDNIVRYECADLASGNSAVLKLLLDNNIQVVDVVAERESIHNLYKALVEC